VEEISRQLSIQAIAQVLLAAISQVYSENQEQNAEQKDLKTCILCRKANVQEGMVSEEGSAIKKKPSTLYQYNRKDALMASQETARFHLSQAPGY
jgi:hypothetical protein